MAAPRLIPLGDTLGIAAEAIVLDEPVDAETARTLRRALLDRLVLCIRGQVLTPQRYLAAMRTFGEPITQVRQISRHPQVPEIMILSSETVTMPATGSGSSSARIGTAMTAIRRYPARSPCSMASTCRKQAAIRSLSVCMQPTTNCQ